VLDYQEPQHKKEQPAAEKQRGASAGDMAAAADNSAGEQVKSERQAGDGGPERWQVGKAVFVRITLSLDWRDQAQTPQHEHDSRDDEKDGTQLRRCGDFRLVHAPPPCGMSVHLAYQSVRPASA
jgi:hypothetical protein